MPSAQAPACSDFGGRTAFSALSLERLKKPVGELLMHMGETYRQIQEERELIDRALPRRPDGKVGIAFPSAL